MSRVVEVVEQLLGRVAERAQQHRRVHLAAAVDAHVEDVLGVELEVEPRAAVRDDARASRAACRDECVLPLSWSKKTPGQRWSWQTTTRSVPLMMNVPFSVISGISPK